MRTVEARRVKGTSSFRVIVPASESSPKHAKWFRTKEQADAFARKVNDERNGRIDELYRLDRASQAILVHALKKAGSAQAVFDAVCATGNAVNPRTVREIIDALIRDREDARRSKQYVSALRWTLNSFAIGRNDLPVSSVTTQSVRDWLKVIGGTPDMRRAYITRIRGYFTFAINNRWLRENPAKAISMPERRGSEPKILTNEQCQTLLTKCVEIDNGMLRYFTLCLFAGLRPSEARRLRPEQIRSDSIHVPKSIALKSRDARNITINETLRAWLDAGGEFPVPGNWKKRFQTIVKAAGFNWRDYQDSMRHTFVSNYCAIHGWQETVNQAGHSLAMLLEHYRALVPTTEARKFWELRP